MDDKNNLNTYTFYLKNGNNFDVVGGEMTIKTYDGTIIGYEIENCKNFFKVNIDDISAIVRKESVLNETKN